MTVHTIIQCLQSTKARERNEGLDNIEQCLPGLFSSDIKEVILVCKALLSMIHYESLQKDKTGTAAKRMGRASSLLRSNIEQSIKKLPARPAGYISLVSSMILQIDDLVFSDFIKTIQAIVSQQYVRDHFNLQAWEACTQLCMSGITDADLSERQGVFRYSECLHTLNILINSNTSNPLTIDMIDLDGLVKSFYKFIEQKQENILVYTNMLKITNKLIMSLSCEQYGLLARFVPLGFKVVARAKFNYRHSISLNDQIALFLNLDLVYQLIRRFDFTEFESLFKVIQGLLVHELNELHSIGCLIQPNTVGLTSNDDPKHWFNLNTVYLIGNDPGGWFFLMGLSKLTKKYYDLKNLLRDRMSDDILDGESSESSHHISTKRRRHDGFVDALSSSTNEWEFIGKLLTTDKSGNSKLIGLKFLLFMSECNLLQIDPGQTLHYIDDNETGMEKVDTTTEDLDWNTSLFANNSTIHQENSSFQRSSNSPSAFSEDIITILLTTSNYRTLTYWSLLTLNSLVYNITRSDFSLEPKRIRNMVKMILPCVKSEATSKLACHLLYHLVELIIVKNVDLHDEPDTSLISQVQNTLELANYLGPSYLDDASFLFWLAFFKLMKRLGLNVNNFQSILTSWFLTKWGQVFDVESGNLNYLSSFSGFVYWMTKNQVKPLYFPNHDAYRGDMIALYFVQSRKQLSPDATSVPEPTEADFTDLIIMDGSFEQVVRRFFSLGSVFAKNGNKFPVQSFYAYKLMALDLALLDTELEMIASMENPDLNHKEKSEVINMLREFKKEHLYSKLFTCSTIFEVGAPRQASMDMDMDLISEPHNDYTIPTMDVIDYCAGVQSGNVSELKEVDKILSVVWGDKDLIKQSDYTDWIDSISAGGIVYLLYKISCAQFQYNNDVCHFINYGLLILGKKVLNNPYFERNELVFVALCRLTAKLYGVTESQNMFEDFLRWLEMAANKKLILTEASFAAYITMITKILSYYNKNKRQKSSIDVTSRIKDLSVSLISSFGSSPIHIRIGCAQHISQYLSSLVSFTEQISLYKKLVSCFDAPTEYYSAVGYCRFLTSMSVKSLDINKSILFNLSEVAWSNDDFVEVVQNCLESYCARIGASDLRGLLKVIKVPLFRAWYSHHSFEKFPYALIDKGYKSIEDFYLDNGKELLSVIVSSKSKHITNDYKVVLQAVSKPVAKGFYTMAYPLAFVSGGIKGDVIQVLGHLTNQTPKSFDKDLVILEILKLIDTSRLDYLTNLTGIAIADVEFKAVSSPLSDTINLKTGLELIRGLVGTTEGYWDTRRLYFFCRQLMVDLDFCLTDLQRLICLRRVILVITLCKKSKTTSKSCLHYELLQTLFEVIIPLYQTPLLRRDVINFYNALELEKYTKEYDSENEEDTSRFMEYEKLIMILLSTILDANPSEVSLDRIAGCASILDKIAASPSEYKDVFAFIRQLTISKKPNGSRFDAIRFLKYKVKDSYEAGLRVCSFLSHYNCLSGTDSSAFLDVVLESPVSHLSDSFKRLCAKGIGTHKFPEASVSNGKNSEYEFDDIGKQDYLQEIIRLVFKSQENQDLGISCKADVTVGILLGLDNSLVDEICPTKSEYILPLQDNAIDHFFTTSKETSLKGTTGFSKEFAEWVSHLYVSLVDKLSLQRHRYLSPLKQFAACNLEFAVESLPYLVCNYLKYGSTSGPTVVFDLLTSFVTTTSLHTRKSCEVIVKTVLLIRQESKRKNINFENVYDALDLESICAVAANFKFHKTGLMIFEDYYSNKDKDQTSGKSSIKWYERQYIQQIFESIDCEDFVNGLPRETTIQSALQSSYDIIENNSAGRMKFELGSFESSRVLKLNKSPADLLDTMLSDGLNSTSKIIGESSNIPLATQSTSNHSYEWSWKLNDWHLPSPERPQSTDEYIYKALHSLRDATPLYLDRSGKDTSESQEILSRVAINILEDKDINRSSMGIHSAENLACNLAISNSVLTLYETGGFSPIENTKLDKIQFSKVETFMLSRTMALNILTSKDHTQSNNMLNNLAWYNNLCLQNHKVQNSINTIMLMKDISQAHSVTKESMQIVKYHSAKGLWEQKYQTGAISLMLRLKEEIDKAEPQDTKLDQDYDGINLAMVNSTLVEWLSQSRQELPTTLLEGDYFSGVSNTIGSCSPRLISEVHDKLGRFCEDQYRNGDVNVQLNRINKQISSKRRELERLKDHYSKQSVPSQEKRTVQKYYTNLKQQIASESADQQSLKDTKKAFLIKCLKCYMISISQTDNFEIVDKFFSLWFEASHIREVNEVVERRFSIEFHNSPHKFVSWISQLVSRLSDEPDTDIFQNLVQRLICSICIKYPFHSLYHLISLKEHVNQMGTDTNNEVMFSRIRAANKVYDKVRSAKVATHSLDIVVSTISRFCSECINLSKYQLSKSKKLDLRNSSKLNGNFWLNLPDIPSPTQSLDIVPMDQIGNYPRLESMDPIIQVASSGLSLPKIGKLRLTDGRHIKILFKSGVDDLRQDAVMEQVFEKVNMIFKTDKRSLKRSFNIRTYKIVPLGPNSGIIEFVPNSVALIDIIKPYHDKVDKIDTSKAREMMRSCQNESRSERIKIFKLQIISKVRPVLHHFFFDNFLTPQTWFDSKISYSRGLATSSIVGHILGLGDRHCNNILIDKHSGEPIHIDLGVAFDQGTRLQVPETVPFRLTRDLVDGLGITGVEGVFRNSCEVTFEILRKNQDHIISILNIFKWDPLYKWTISPLRKRKLQDNTGHNNELAEEENDISEGGRAIMTVKDKLQANGLSTATIVRELIGTATNIENLALIFGGWCPFY